MSKLNNAYALLIGVGDDLAESINDAIKINNILIDETLAGYPEENVFLLTDKDATKENIVEAFDTLIEKVDEDSSVLLFYSGHGGHYVDLEDKNRYFLQPYGMREEMSYEEKMAMLFSSEDLKNKLSQLNSKRLVFFLDCCHAAGMTKGGLNWSESATTADEDASNPYNLSLIHI